MKKTLGTFLILISSILLVFATPTEGAKAVASAGTAEPLSATSVPVKWVLVQAETDNTGNIYIGFDSSPNFTLDAGESIKYEDVDIGSDFSPSRWLDLDQIYIDADSDGEGVIFQYWAHE